MGSHAVIRRAAPFLGVVAASALAPVAAGCEDGGGAVEENPTAAAVVIEKDEAGEGEPPTEPEGLLDADITLAVEDELLSSDAVPSHRVDLETSEGVVTLSGAVASLLAKRRAAEAARTVRGVRSVVNRIQVMPEEVSDLEIERGVEQSLRRDPATEAYEVGVSVDDGAVTLSGEVESWQEKQLAEAVAAGVRGVRAVENGLRINIAEDRPAGEIEKEVQRRLARDVWVDDALIEVDVADDRVLLAGVVGSAAERTQAYEDAWVAGVADVDASGIEVQWWARDRMRRDPETWIDKGDEALENAIRDAFLYDPRIDGFEPTVDVTDGVATLTGTVDNLAAKRAAAQDASNTVGIWRVRNYLRVRPDVLPGDEELRDRIHAAIGWNPYVHRHDLTVRVTNGEVDLYGRVDSHLEKREAVRVASTVGGVVDVDSHLRVDSGDDRETDWALEDDVKRKLIWDPFVAGPAVEVEVEGGVVTLEGTVSDWRAYHAAMADAFEAGARRVVNRLAVEQGPEELGPGQAAREAREG